VALDSDFSADRQALLRRLRHELESLRRAGLEWVPSGRSRAFATIDRAGEASVEPDRPAPVRPDNLTGPGAETERQSSPIMHVGRELAASDLGPAPTPPTPPPSPPPVVTLGHAGSLFGASEFETPAVPVGERPAKLEFLAREVAACTKCAELAETRTQTVFGVGTPSARLMFIGEAPGGEEDRQGEPFVGRAGQLLTDMITKGMGLSRDQVYIANILKCRPPDNRTPSFAECANCVGYLEQQIAIIRPEFICVLGLIAAQTLLETTQSLGRLRGRWHSYRGIRTIVTYHPAYLLRSPSFKKQAWEDLQMLMNEIGLPLPKSRARPGE
jgi:uracil-DNA glycosylase family 4